MAVKKEKAKPTDIYTPEVLEKRRRYLFNICESKEELHAFLKAFLKIDLPNYTVDENSNSNPMQFVWEVYNTMKTNKGEKIHVVAASRNSAKTLTSAIIHFLGMVHFRRSCVQMSAIKDQSKACLRYLKKFLNIPELKEFFERNSVFEFGLNNLPSNEYTTKSDAQCVVVAATIDSANGQRGSCLPGGAKILVPSETEKAIKHSGYTYKTIAGIYRRHNRGEKIKVISFNKEKMELEPRDVIAVSRRLEKDRLVIKTEDGKEIECTGNHPLAISFGSQSLEYLEADKLKVGDHLVVKAKCYASSNALNKDKSILRMSDTPIESSFAAANWSVDEVIEGSLLGDGCISRRKDKLNGGYKASPIFLINKTARVEPYLLWIKDILNTKFKAKMHVAKSGYSDNKMIGVNTGQNSDLFDLYNKWCPNGKKIIPKDLNFTWEKFAILMMDDGSSNLRTISTCSFTEEENLFLCSKINQLVGFECASTYTSVQKKTGNSYRYIKLIWPREHKDKYLKLASYFHESYFYKIQTQPVNCQYCGVSFYRKHGGTICDNPECKIAHSFSTLQYLKIVSITKKTANMQLKTRWVYDIQVDHNNNFFNNRYLVHNCIIKDELDLVKKEIISEIAMVADPTQDEHQFDPISISLSSRKSNSGPIQKLIEDSENPKYKGVLRLHKWSSVDYMKQCTPDIHGPKNQIAHINDNTLQVMFDTEDKKFEDQDSVVKASFRKLEVYEGCATCPAFISCQGRAPNQKSTSKMLRGREFVGLVIQDTSEVNKIKAQILNLEPETSGLVFPLLSKALHLKAPEDTFLFMSGEDWYQYADKNIGKGYKKPPTKLDLYNYASSKGWKVSYGIDWGFTDPAVVMVSLYNQRTNQFVMLHARHSPGYSNSHWADTVKASECKLMPPDLICPDMEDASSHTYFMQDGYAVWRNKPKKIEPGVSQIRALMWNPTTQKSHFVIANFDEESQWAYDSLMKWSHKKNPAGTFDMGSYEDDDNCHFIDSCRYSLEPFRVHIEARITASSAKPATDNVSSVMQAVNQTYRDAGAHIPDIMGDAILQAYRDAGLEKHIVDDPGATKKADKKKSSFKFSF